MTIQEKQNVGWDRAHTNATFTVTAVFENGGTAVIEDDHGYRYLALLTELTKIDEAEAATKEYEEWEENHNPGPWPRGYNIG